MSLANQRILVTGANGFIGRNFSVRLGELPGRNLLKFLRGDDVASLPALIAQVDAVVHLAGENRPADVASFARVNEGLTASVCDAIQREFESTGRHVPLVFTSSAQAALDNPYGRSKKAAEDLVDSLGRKTGNPCTVFRLPGVFGKWCRPDYNSVVATFCHNLARDLPVQVNDPATPVRLVYVDDVVSAILDALASSSAGVSRIDVHPVHTISLGDLVEQIRAFRTCRTTLMSERVGTSLTRALYATYVSYLPCEKFSYEVPVHADPRGVFVEMLKTPDCGQFSYFTAYPGITRGGHYHHTKTEKFLVIKGKALFSFRHLVTQERFELHTSGEKPTIVDTIPGWSHDITNVGEEEMVVMLWASENFDRQRPDTVAEPT